MVDTVVVDDMLLLLLGVVCRPGYMGYAARGGGSEVLSGGSGDRVIVDKRLGMTLPRGVVGSTVCCCCCVSCNGEDVLPLGKEEEIVL